MSKCLLCEEKDKRIKALLKGYKGDKKEFREEEKWYKIAIASLIGVIVIMSVGVDNAIKLYNAVKDFF